MRETHDIQYTVACYCYEIPRPASSIQLASISKPGCFQEQKAINRHNKWFWCLFVIVLMGSNIIRREFYGIMTAFGQGSSRGCDRCGIERAEINFCLLLYVCFSTGAGSFGSPKFGTDAVQIA